MCVCPRRERACWSAEGKVIVQENSPRPFCQSQKGRTALSPRDGEFFLEAALGIRGLLRKWVGQVWLSCGLSKTRFYCSSNPSPISMTSGPQPGFSCSKVTGLNLPRALRSLYLVHVVQRMLFICFSINKIICMHVVKGKSLKWGEVSLRKWALALLLFVLGVYKELMTEPGVTAGTGALIHLNMLWKVRVSELFRTIVTFSWELRKITAEPWWGDNRLLRSSYVWIILLACTLPDPLPLAHGTLIFFCDLQLLL